MTLAARAPVKAAYDRVPDIERVHQRDGVEPERRLLAVPDGINRAKQRRTEAPQIRNDHPIPRRPEPRRDLGVGMYVVRPPMEQQDGGPFRGPGLDVTDIEDARLDLLDGAECRAHHF